MDTATAEHFIHMVRAIRLLGAECVLTGINPELAQAVVHMGMDLAHVACHRTLRDALAHFIDLARAPRPTTASKGRAPPD
jgi:rsbT co-antagonist protein RsbR